MNFLSRLGLQCILPLLLLLSLSGCMTTSSDERWQPVVRENGNQVHVVKWSDETLSAIAQWYTGSRQYVDAIANANPTLDPLDLHLGESIFIPQSLLTTRADMSREYLDTFLASLTHAKHKKTGPVSYTKPRVIKPQSYKGKKGEVSSAESESLHLVQGDEAEVEPRSAPVPEQTTGLQLFGPK